jgi:glycosyltransferase involved in cell wall biosynthesis
MNVPFCLWLLARRHNPTLTMFHEVAYPLDRRQPLRHNLLGAVNRLMAWLTARSSHGLFASIPAWLDALRPFARSGTPLSWLPVPSTLPTAVDSDVVAAVRGRFASSPDCRVVGHFGTFGPLVAPMLASVLPVVLEADERRIGLLLGRGGEAFAEGILRTHPGLRGRLHARSNLLAEDVAVHLAACDLLIQPYPDGVSSRRTSAMAGLALGRSVVTTEGPLSEPLWRESKAVLLAPTSSSAAMVEAVEMALHDNDLRAALGARAAELYRERFSLQRVLAALQDP